MILHSIIPHCGLAQSFQDHLPLKNNSSAPVARQPVVVEQMERFAFRPNTHIHIDRIFDTMQMQAEKGKETVNPQIIHRTNSDIRYRGISAKSLTNASANLSTAADNLKKFFGVNDRPATARLVLRVRLMSDPNFDVLEADDNEQRPWVTLDYSFNRADDKEVFKVVGAMQDLLPPDARGELSGWGGFFEKDIQLRIFFKNLDYMINNLEGRVFWNGFLIDLAGPPSSRLQLVDLEMDPLRLIFSVTRIKELYFVRGRKRYEIQGKPLGKGGNRQFKLRGLGSDQIKENYPRDGTVVINFPPYFACMNDDV